MTKSQQAMIKPGSTKRFVELTRPLLTSKQLNLVSTMALLDAVGMRKLGTGSKIVKLQQDEILTEIALRN